jgi:hypothetical protein
VSDYAIFGEWLAKCVDQCTCYGGEFGHEPGCGYEPVAKIAEIEAALSAAERVRKLHRPLENSISAMYPEPQCAECHEDHPCPTISALTAVDFGAGA